MNAAKLHILIAVTFCLSARECSSKSACFGSVAATRSNSVPGHSSLFLSPILQRKQAPSNLTVLEGSTLILTCSPGNHAKMFWLRAKQKKKFALIGPLLPKRRTFAGNTRYFQPSRTNLVVNNASVDDSGWFACAAKCKSVLNIDRLLILKLMHVRVVKRNPTSPQTPTVSSPPPYAAPFELGSGFSIISNVMNIFSIIAFFLSIFGCLCCGGCF